MRPGTTPTRISQLPPPLDLAVMGDVARRHILIGTKSSFSNSWICTTSRQIPASASTYRGPENGGLVLKTAVMGDVARRHTKGQPILIGTKSTISIAWICTTRHRIVVQIKEKSGYLKSGLIPHKR